MHRLLASLFCLVCLALTAENLLPGDTGYEIGLGYFDQTWYNRGIPLELSQEGGAPQGSSYATFSLPAQANYCYHGPLLHLQKKTDYVFSCWVKSSGKATGRLGVVSNQWKDTQFHDFQLTQQWTRIEIPFQPQVGGEYWLLFDIYSQDDQEGQIAFDGIQLEHGRKATPYAGNDLVTSLRIPSPFRKVFFADETPELLLTAIDTRTDVPPQALRYTLQVTDYQGNTILEENNPVAWNGQSFRKSILLTEKALGLYTVRVNWFDADGKTVASQFDSLAIVPRQRAIDPEIRPYSGVVSDVPAGVERLGVRWAEVAIWWCTLQPEIDRYDFEDTLKRLRTLKERGFLIKFTLVHLPCTPAWAWRPDEVAEAREWGFEPNFRFRPSDESIPKLEKMFEDFLTEARPYIDLVELGGEDELIGGAEPYYRKKFAEDVQNGAVNGPVCTSIAQIVNACIRASRRACPEIPVSVGRPSGGDCYANNFGFSRNVLKNLTEPYDYFGMDCYTYQMRYLDYGNMSNIGSPNRDYPGVFERARNLTAEVGKNQPPFVSEYGFAIDNRLAPDDPLQQEETARMTSAILIAKLIGSPFFFYFNTYGCIESSYYDYGLWHDQTPMLLIPALAASTQVVEGVHKTAARLGTPESNLKLGLFGQKDRAILALWTDRVPNPVRLALPKDTTATDFLGNPIQIPKDGLFTASILPTYLILEGEDAFDQLKNTLDSAQDVAFSLEAALTLLSKKQARITIQDTAGNTAAKKLKARFQFDNGKTKSVVKSAGKDFPWTFPVKLSNGAKEMKLEIMDNSGQKLTTLFPLAFTPLQKGKNHIASFGDERKDIVPPDPHIQWSGRDDLGGTISLDCTPETITIEAVISDDLHCHNSDITQLWEGDCFQVAFVPTVSIAPDSRNEGYSARDSEFVFALNANAGPLWQGYAKRYCEPMRNGQEFTITRNEETHTTTYRITFQRKALGLEKRGQFFRFSCVIFDDDEGSGQSYYYQLSPGITVTKAPSQFPIFQLP